MTVVASVEARVFKSSGKYYCRAPHAHENYWRRIVANGEKVLIIARISSTPLPGATEIGPGITVVPVDDFTRGAGRLRAILAAAKTVHRLAGQLDGRIYARLPGLMGFLVGLMAVIRRKPLITHLVGDPVRAAPTLPLPSGSRLARWVFMLLTKILVKKSSAFFYVDARTAVDYPGAGAARHSKRNVELDLLVWAAEPKSAPSGPLVLITAGTQEQPYKGHDLLIAAASELVKRGRTITVKIVGDGQLHSDLQRQSAALNPTPSVEFLGHVSGTSALQEVLRSSDLFVLPSRTEGFPRVLVEAMAAGLPCLATDVGAVREVLPPWLLIGQPEAICIADAIDRLICEPQLLELASFECHAAGRAFRAIQAAEDSIFFDRLSGR